ncbi:UDP-N-acetylmuramoyl-L-alanine--D-glutamate ligase [Undibacterium cyanobacteriorum]|uniref:UDP-N-acetylmuramoylalanine--D-glutamate ligase n=1 Tax=Undibacterium cyanobacteriorum TaxID=3073561 RepID=A0ABY9RFG8_9BURK|nr:UDP-N-acetylmuramoyl-L-alanine--D-glutamate ligase [Undibacterium sp. 20NA77.5]WMW79970.1 UDP-N-acetylmuramoyl-L-alanine--D-glutamate ligase [Undibacterium sp. 20NA77.5]
MNFVEKRILVVGLGESGLAMARWLKRVGAQLRVADTRSQPDRLSQLQALAPEAEFFGGPLQASLLEGIDAVFVSPGLAPHGELQVVLQQASELGVPVWGELELFSLALAELKETQAYQPKLIAITGTNGKTTVTSLTGQLCARAGMQTRIAGNISPAMLDVLCECLDQKILPQVWVLELSSFQLHSSVSFNPDVATVLNVTQDHLDWHGDMKNYCDDKAKIFGTSTVLVLNRDDALVMAMRKPQHQDVLSFGFDAPKNDGEFGLLDEGGMVWLACANSPEEEEGSSRKRKKMQEAAEVFVTRLMPSDALKIRGQHNASNALAALALCRSIGLPLAPLLHALRDYKGEPHRVELVNTIGDVSYFDDSKGTNVGATVAALRGLGAEAVGDAPRIILLAGGDGKGQDFTPLAKPVMQYVKAVCLIGKDAPAIRAALEVTQVNLLDCQSLEQAVEKAAEMAQAGDIVLLSPACASLDMFKNYAHRAQVFIDAVREVALNRGEVC